MNRSRVSLRYEVELPAHLRVGGCEHVCEVRDVSLGGAFVFGPLLDCGTPVTLRFDGEELEELEVACMSRWHDDHGTGLAFELPVVDAPMLAKLIRASRQKLVG